MHLIYANTEERRPTFEQVDKRLDIVEYGYDNLYPQAALAAIRGSGIAFKGVDITAKHYVGTGFIDDVLNSFQVGTDVADTSMELLRAVAHDYARFRGFCIYVGYNEFGVARLKHIPFEHVRICKKGEYGDYAIWHDWERSTKEKPTKDNVFYCNRYTGEPPEDVENSSGELLYYSADGKDVYPLSTIDPEREGVQTDSQLSNFHLSNVTNSFTATKLVQVGNLTEEAREEIQNTLNGFQGADKTGKIVLLETGTEENFNVQDMQPTNVSDLFKETEVSVHKRLQDLFGIPAVLYGQAVPGSLGLTTLYEQAQEVFDDMTGDARRVLSDAFKMLLSSWWNATGIEDYSIGLLSDRKDAMFTFEESQQVAELIAKYRRGELQQPDLEWLLKYSYAMSNDRIDELFVSIQAQETYNDYPQAATDGDEGVDYAIRKMDELE